MLTIVINPFSLFIMSIMDNIKVVGYLGSSQHKVYHAKIFGHSFVLKIRTAEDRITKEDEILQTIDHPNIVKCFGKYLPDPIIKKLIPDAWEVIVMEYIEGYQLRCLEHNPILSVRDVYYIILDLLRTVYYLHNRGIIHNDIHMDNILQTGSKKIYLIDFGEATTFSPCKQEMPPNDDIENVITIGFQLAKWIKQGNSNRIYDRLHLYINDSCYSCGGRIVYAKNFTAKEALQLWSQSTSSL